MFRQQPQPVAMVEDSNVIYSTDSEKQKQRLALRLPTELPKPPMMIVHHVRSYITVIWSSKFKVKLQNHYGSNKLFQKNFPPSYYQPIQGYIYSFHLILNFTPLELSFHKNKKIYILLKLLQYILSVWLL